MPNLEIVNLNINWPKGSGWFIAKLTSPKLTIAPNIFKKGFHFDKSMFWKTNCKLNFKFFCLCITTDNIFYALDLNNNLISSFDIYCSHSKGINGDAVHAK